MASRAAGLVTAIIARIEGRLFGATVLRPRGRAVARASGRRPQQHGPAVPGLAPPHSDDVLGVRDRLPGRRGRRLPGPRPRRPPTSTTLRSFRISYTWLRWSPGQARPRDPRPLDRRAYLHHRASHRGVLRVASRRPENPA